MPRLVSVQTMLAQIDGLRGTNDLTEWEADFVQDVVNRTGSGAQVQPLTDKQITVIERIWRKHFS